MRAAHGTVLLLALLTTTFARASDGDLDPSFGLAGVAYAGITDASSYSGMTVQPDGKVLACGTHATGNQRDFIVVRFLADGSTDPGFGTNGRVSIAFDHAPYVAYNQCYSLAVQPDGKIVAAGSTRWNVGPAIFGTFAVARLAGDGTLDPAFGEGGKATAVGTPGLISVADAGSVALQADGRIVLGGQLWGIEDLWLTYRFALARFMSDGTLDLSFNGTGWTAISFPDDDAVAVAVALDAQARIVIAGSSTHSYAKGSGNTDFAVARVLPNGSLDASFGQAGRALVAFDAGGSGSQSDIAYGLAIDHAGRTVIVGMADTSSTTTPNYDVAVARLLGDGSPDAAFGDAGKVRVAFDRVPSGMDYARAVVVQADGKLVLAGGAQGEASSGAPILGRLTDDGSLDPHFGDGGRRILHIGSANPEVGVINRAALAGDRVFVSGVEKTAATTADYFVARVSITLEDGIFADGFE
jgi:uncharacterized delta-60 repeat protein